MRVSDGVSDVELSGAVPYKAPRACFWTRIYSNLSAHDAAAEEQVWRGVLG